MAEDRIIPHILIEADAGLADWLADRLRGTVEPSELPFLYSFSALKNAFRVKDDQNAVALDPTGRRRAPKRACLHFVPLIRHLLDIGNGERNRQEDGDVLDAFLEELRHARSYFKLKDDQLLRVVVAGGHSSISDNLKLCDTRIEVSALGYESWRSNRQLAGKLGAALERIGGLQLEWLSDAAPELRPRDTTTDSDLVAVAAMARSYLGQIDAHAPEDPETVTKPGALPLIYVRDGAKGPWRRFGSGADPPASRTTLKLIGQFAQAKKMSPSLEGVLVKVHPEDVSGRNIADALLLTAEQRLNAAAADLRAILLDRRYGIIGPDGTRGLPVYAV